MGTTEKNLAKLNTSTEYNTWLVKRDSLIFFINHYNIIN